MIARLAQMAAMFESKFAENAADTSAEVRKLRPETVDLQKPVNHKWCEARISGGSPRSIKRESRASSCTELSATVTSRM
jgi:hypothetical protein